VDEAGRRGPYFADYKQVLVARLPSFWHVADTWENYEKIATDRLKNSSISRVVVTDTLPLGPERRFEKLEILSVAPLVANAISAIFEDSSVSEIFGGENLL